MTPEELSKLRNNFSSYMHDLTAIIRGVSIRTVLMKDDCPKLPQEALEHLEFIERKVSQYKEIENNLLNDFEKLFDTA